jgi:hypothetical protein
VIANTQDAPAERNFHASAPISFASHIDLTRGPAGVPSALCPHGSNVRQSTIDEVGCSEIVRKAQVQAWISNTFLCRTVQQQYIPRGGGSAESTESVPYTRVAVLVARAHPTSAEVVVPNGAVTAIMRARLGPNSAGATATPACWAPATLRVTGAVLASIVLLAADELGFHSRRFGQQG